MRDCAILEAKNLAVYHLPPVTLPPVSTWTANCKRDRKAVVTWKKRDAKVSNKIHTYAKLDRAVREPGEAWDFEGAPTKWGIYGYVFPENV